MKKINILMLVLCVLAIQITVYSQGYKGKGKLKGLVSDEQGNPVEGVTVKLYCERGASGLSGVLMVGGAKRGLLYPPPASFSPPTAVDSRRSRLLGANARPRFRLHTASTPSQGC